MRIGTAGITLNKSIMKWLILLIILAAPTTAYSQWNFADIERLQGEGASSNEIIYAIKINEGLYSLSQFPYIMKDLDISINEKDWENSLDLIDWAVWLLAKNAIRVEMWRSFTNKLLVTPTPAKCWVIEGLYYSTNTYECTSNRKFIADSYIIALNLQQQMYRHTGLRQDLENVAMLAGILELRVYGVDGQPYIITRQYGGIQQVDNLTIREDYLPYRYRIIQRDAEKELAELAP